MKTPRGSVLVLLLLNLLRVSWAQSNCIRPSIPGIPGIPGKPGSDGKPGTPGTKGEQGTMDAGNARGSLPKALSPTSQVSGPSQEGLGLPLPARKGHDSPQHLAHVGVALLCPTCGSRNVTKKKMLRLT